MESQNAGQILETWMINYEMTRHFMKHSIANTNNSNGIGVELLSAFQ